MGNFRFLTAGESHGPGVDGYFGGHPGRFGVGAQRYKRYVVSPSTRLRRGRADDD